MIFNDADGCYDCIPPASADIALMHLGCPKMVMRAHTVAQKRMKHFIKTGSGVSLGYIAYSKIIQTMIMTGIIIIMTGPIGRVGQGGGASPIIWHAILLIMLEVYKQSNDGIKVSNRINLTSVMYWIIGYVDDNSIIRGLIIKAQKRKYSTA